MSFLRRVPRFARAATFIVAIVAVFCTGAVLLIRHPIIGTVVLTAAVGTLVVAALVGRPKKGPPILASWDYQDEPDVWPLNMAGKPAVLTAAQRELAADDAAWKRTQDGAGDV